MMRGRLIRDMNKLTNNTMSIKAKFGDKKNFEPVPAGNHVARVYSIIHLGVIQGEYMGQPNEKDTVRITFELPNETKVFKEGTEPQPMVISSEFTLSMGEKANLRKFVEGIEGVAFHDEEAETYDVTELMGKTCLINVVHKISAAGSKYAKIQSAAPLPKGMEAPPAHNPPFILDFDENWDNDKFNSLPDFLKDKIRSTRNFTNKFPDHNEIKYPDDNDADAAPF